MKKARFFLKLCLGTLIGFNAGATGAVAVAAAVAIAAGAGVAAGAGLLSCARPGAATAISAIETRADSLFMFKIFREIKNSRSKAVRQILSRDLIVN